MRGDDNQQEGIFSYISPEKRVPTEHPDLTGLIQSSWRERESLTRRTGHADEETQAGANRSAAAAD